MKNASNPTIDSDIAIRDARRPRIINLSWVSDKEAFERAKDFPRHKIEILGKTKTAVYRLVDASGRLCLVASSVIVRTARKVSATIESKIEDTLSDQGALPDFESSYERDDIIRMAVCYPRKTEGDTLESIREYFSVNGKYVISKRTAEKIKKELDGNFWSLREKFKDLMKPEKTGFLLNK